MLDILAGLALLLVEARRLYVAQNIQHILEFYLKSTNIQHIQFIDPLQDMSE
jgi:hypothetical protein